MSKNRYMQLATHTSAMLIGLGFLFYLIHEQTQYPPREGALWAEVPLFPIPIVFWYTSGWIIFSALLWLIFRVPFQQLNQTGDLELRRYAILCVVVAYAVELYARVTITGFFGLEYRALIPAIVTVGVIGLLMVAAFLRRPPSSVVLFVLLMCGGIAMRVAWLVLVTPHPQHVDSIFVIRNGMERMLAGGTPYAYFDFGTHTNPMPYLPWTFLSYVPTYLAGIDLRINSTLFSLALVGVFWRVFSALRVAPQVRNGLLLVLAVYYALPISVSLDGNNEFGLYNLMLVLTFAFVALNRLRLSAVAYGFALGAMPVALFCAAPLLCFVIRTKPWREGASITLIVTAISATPVVLFMIWDANAFLWAVSYVPRESWKALDSGELTYPTLTPIAWHYLGGWLRLVQVTWLAVFAALAATRMNTVHGLIGLSCGSYLMLVLSGPYVGPHLVQVVPFLAVLGVVVSATNTKL